MEAWAQAVIATSTFLCFLRITATQGTMKMQAGVSWLVSGRTSRVRTLPNIWGRGPLEKSVIQGGRSQESESSQSRRHYRKLTDKETCLEATETPAWLPFPEGRLRALPKVFPFSLSSQACLPFKGSLELPFPLEASSKAPVHPTPPSIKSCPSLSLPYGQPNIS